METEPKFESALDELEQIVATLEQGDAPLDASLASYERGIQLLARCHGLLEGAERTVALLAGVDDDGTPQTTHFDATATVQREATGAEPAKKPRTRRAPKSDDQIPF